MSIQFHFKKIIKTVLVGILVCLLSIHYSVANTNKQGTTKHMVDKKASAETVRLLEFLKQQSGTHILFGAHNTNIRGRDWKDISASKKTSDVLQAVGDFPAIFSFDFNYGFQRLNSAVQHAHAEGGIITFSWHAKNFATGKNFYDTTGNVMNRILPGGDLNAEYIRNLDSIANFALQLKHDGSFIPIIFRPFHENTGSWFWWGAKHCTPEIYKRVWQYTVKYLRDEKGVHNFLYAYSPSKPAQIQKETYETRYPGNEYVDIIGFDYYGPDDYSEELLENCRLVVNLAKEKNKIAAITETGVRKGIKNTQIEDWYVKCLLHPIKNDSIARNIAYMVTWSSGWIPAHGELNHAGFKKFYDDEFTWFADDLPEK